MSKYPTAIRCIAIISLEGGVYKSPLTWIEEDQAASMCLP